MNLPVRNSRIRLSQGQIFWREVGQGSTLVFLHGSWWTGDQWADLVPALSPSHHCLIPDLLGFGESGRSQGAHSIATQVASLADFLDFLRVNTCILIGHSVGAWIATAYALQYPDRVKGLVLLTPEGVGSPALKHRWHGYGLLASSIPVVGWLLRSLYSLAKLFGKGQRLKLALRHWRYLQLAPTACQLLFQRRRAELEAEFLGDRLSELTCPVELVQGEQDEPMAIALIHAFAEAAHSSIAKVPGDTGKMEPWLHLPNPQGSTHRDPWKVQAAPSSDAFSDPQLESSHAPSIEENLTQENQRHSLLSPDFLSKQPTAQTLHPVISSPSGSPTETTTHETLNRAIAYAIKDFIDYHHL